MPPEITPSPSTQPNNEGTRRDFLKKIALGAFSTRAALNVLSAEAQSESSEDAEQQKEFIALEFPGLAERIEKEGKNGRLAIPKEVKFEVQAGSQKFILQANSDGEHGDGEVVVLREEYMEGNQKKVRFVFTANTKDALFRFHLGAKSPLITGARITKEKGLPVNTTFRNAPREGVDFKAEEMDITDFESGTGVNQIPPNDTEFIIGPRGDGHGPGTIESGKTNRSLSFFISPGLSGGQSEKGKAFVGISDFVVRNPDFKKEEEKGSEVLERQAA